MKFPSKMKREFQRHIDLDLRAAKYAAGDKEKQRRLLLRRKAEIVATQQIWIDSHRYLLQDYCRTSLPNNYIPKSLTLVPCQEQWQHDLWRIVKLTHWSMPPNEYVGRRYRILVFDGDYLVEFAHRVTHLCRKRLSPCRAQKNSPGSACLHTGRPPASPRTRGPHPATGQPLKSLQ